MEIYKIAETEEGLSREEIRRALLQALREEASNGR